MAISEYGSFFSLMIFGLFLFPAILLGIYEKNLKVYGACISIPILYLICGDRLKYFVLFLLVEFILVFIYYKFDEKIRSKYFYYAILSVSILPVVYTKLVIYTHMNNIEFLGMSYMGFRIWQLIIEIHDKHIKKFDWLNIVYFISFFPTLSSGPIDRYQRFCDDFKDRISRKKYIDEFCIIGIEKILYGIVYKFAIANTINVFFLSKIPHEVTLFHAIEYMYTYTAYLFFDFAGYSYFAIGTSYILGIRAPENFNKPFLSKNMKEFWERWHMSLSKWFGDYVFSRFVLNSLRSGFFKKQVTATRCGYMLTMFIMGLWHGFTAFYILYGIYQGVALVLTDMYLKSKAYRRHIKHKYYTLYSRLICFHIIAFGLLIFSGYLIKF